MISVESHRQALQYFFCSYFLATFLSRPLMQIFGWLATLFTFFLFIRLRQWELCRNVWKLYPWKILLTMFATVVAGLLINSVDQRNFITAISSQTYMIFLFAWALALTQIEFSERHYRTFLIVVGIISLYAITQSFTGVDLVRPGSNRAVNPLYIGLNESGLFRSAGFLESPIHYSYIAGIHVCFIFAFLLCANKADYRSKLWRLSLGTCIFVLASVITSYTRGAWIGLSITLLMMAFLVKPRLGAIFSGAGIIIVTGLVIASTRLRERLLSLFDPNFASNSDRLFLWKINWEMFNDHPILGIGYLQNEIRVGEYAARLGRPEAYLSHAHNMYLQMLSSTGVVGLLVYLLLVAYMLKVSISLYQLAARDSQWWRTFSLAALGIQIYLHIGAFTEVTFKALPANNHLMVIWAGVIVGHLKLKYRSRSPLLQK